MNGIQLQNAFLPEEIFIDKYNDNHILKYDGKNAAVCIARRSGLDFTHVKKNNDILFEFSDKLKQKDVKKVNNILDQVNKQVYTIKDCMYLIDRLNIKSDEMPIVIIKGKGDLSEFEQICVYDQEVHIDDYKHKKFKIKLINRQLKLFYRDINVPIDMDKDDNINEWNNIIGVLDEKVHISEKKIKSIKKLIKCWDKKIITTVELFTLLKGRNFKFTFITLDDVYK